MQKHQIYINLFAITSALALGACSDKEDAVETPVVPDVEVGEKTPIQLSVGGVLVPELNTRATVTDGTTITNFGGDTKVFILMQSDQDTDTHDGLEYKGSRASTLYAPARATVYNSTSQTALVFDAANQKYWDDAHARSSQVSIWAFAQRIATTIDGAWPDYSFQSYNGAEPSLEETATNLYTSNSGYNWQSETPLYPAIFSWSVGNGSPNQNQDANTLIYQDLLFSNNIANYVGNEKVPTTSRTDNRLKFDFSTKKFPASTELKFYHAMSKITINIIAGGGFKTDLSDFTLLNKSNNKKTIDILRNFNTRGLFNIKDGEFQMIHDDADITDIPCSDLKDADNKLIGYKLEALIIPNIHDFLSSTYSSSDPNSLFRNGSSEVLLEFTVGDNTFKLSSGQLFTALYNKPGAAIRPSAEDPVYIPMEAGKNYVFTFTIGKKQINNISARVADWEDVNADELTPSNARIKLQLEERGSDTTMPVDIYRAEDNASSITDTRESYNWETGYKADDKNVFQEVSGTWKLTNNWFWPNNQTYYHFRAIRPSALPLKTDVSTTGDYVELVSGSALDRDVVWGAPMRDVADNETSDHETFKFIYDASTGFDVKNPAVSSDKSQIYQAIGPTEDQLKLTLFHMMSNLVFNIKTTNDADAVTLVNGANKTKVNIIGCSPTGKLLLGNGHVIPGAIDSDDVLTEPVEWQSESSGTHTYGYFVVPQDLTGVKLYITTPDNNQYIVDLKDVVATTINTVNIQNPYTTISEEVPNKGKYSIDNWYPGFKYVYNLTLKKTGIDNISVTIVDWEKVEADDETVTIQ